MPNVPAALTHIMPGMPAGGGWLAPAVLLLLAFGAAIDARSKRVPDQIIIVGVALTSVTQGFYVGWHYAGRHLLIAFAAGLTLYIINEIWFRLRKRDALGMGDAKWTMLAVDCFGPLPAFFAWVIGAWLALGWMLLARLAKRKIARVAFAPFLFIGLLAGLYWMYGR
jgi:leader peptidase (prepilin peptidase)/N-methyltransferase